MEPNDDWAKFQSLLAKTMKKTSHESRSRSKSPSARSLRRATPQAPSRSASHGMDATIKISFGTDSDLQPFRTTHRQLTAALGNRNMISAQLNNPRFSDAPKPGSPVVHVGRLVNTVQLRRALKSLLRYGFHRDALPLLSQTELDVFKMLSGDSPPSSPGLDEFLVKCRAELEELTDSGVRGGRIWNDTGLLPVHRRHHLAFWCPSLGSERPPEIPFAEGVVQFITLRLVATLDAWIRDSTNNLSLDIRDVLHVFNFVSDGPIPFHQEYDDATDLKEGYCLGIAVTKLPRRVHSRPQPEWKVTFMLGDVGSGSDAERQYSTRTSGFGGVVLVGDARDGKELQAKTWICLAKSLLYAATVVNKFTTTLNGRPYSLQFKQRELPVVGASFDEALTW